MVFLYINFFEKRKTHSMHEVFRASLLCVSARFPCFSLFSTARYNTPCVLDHSERSAQRECAVWLLYIILVPLFAFCVSPAFWFCPVAAYFTHRIFCFSYSTFHFSNESWLNRKNLCVSLATIFIYFFFRAIFRQKTSRNRTYTENSKTTVICAM